VDNAAVAFEAQVAQTFAPLLALVIFIHDNPYYPALAGRFDRLAQELLSQVCPGHTVANAPAGCMCIASRRSSRSSSSRSSSSSSRSSSSSGQSVAYCSTPFAYSPPVTPSAQLLCSCTTLCFHLLT
jgi:hypothetical protein